MPFHQEEPASKTMMWWGEDGTGISPFLVEAIWQETLFEVKDG